MMSVFDELERHGDQGWTYSHIYDRNSSAGFINSPSVDKWPSPATHSQSQSCALSGVTTVTGSLDACVQEIKSSDTDSDEVLLVDDPGLLRVQVPPSHHQNYHSPGLYQNVYDNHSPHSLPHGGHSHSHGPSRLLQQLQGPLSLHTNHSGYFHQGQVAASPKPQMHLPVSMHSHLHGHTQQNQLRSVLLDQHHHQQHQQQVMHMQSNMRTDFHGHQQHNNRPNLPQGQGELQYMHGHYVDRTPHRQVGNNFHGHPQRSVHGQVIRHVNGPGGDYPPHRQLAIGVEQNNHPPAPSPLNTFGKQQVISLHGGGGVHPHAGQAGSRDQEKVKVLLPDSYVPHREHQQHGSFPQQQQQQPQQQPNPHLSPSPAASRQTPTTPITDAGGTACSENSTPQGPKEVLYRVEGGDELKLHMVYSVKDNKTGATRPMRWDGQKMVPSDVSLPNSHAENRAGQSPAIDTRGSSQAQTPDSGQGWSQGREGQNNVTGVPPAPNHIGLCRPEASPPISQSPVSATVQENCVSPSAIVVGQKAKPVPRVSATNEVWPTPMPSRKLGNSESVQPSIPLSPENVSEFQASSESQSSVDSQVIEVSPPQQPVSHEPKPPSQTGSTLPQPSAAPAAGNVEMQESNTQRIKRRLKEDEEAYAVCRYCGYSSSNVDFCEGCARKFPNDVKVCIKKQRSEAEILDAASSRDVKKNVVSSSPGGVDKKTFYGNKLKTQSLAFSNSEFDVKKKPQRSRKSGTPNRGIGRGRKSLLKEPVTVTISSDEDEVPKSEGTPQPAVNTSVASAVNTSVASASQQDDDDMSFFPSPEVSKKPACWTLRRQRMQDESGRCMKVKSHNNDDLEKKASSLKLVMVRGVRVGLMRCSGNNLDLLPNVMHFSVNSDRTGEVFHFDVFVPEMVSIRYTLSQMQPVFFIKVSPACGSRLRERLKLTMHTPEYFDPGSNDFKRNMIVVIIETILDEGGLQKMFEKYRRAHSSEANFLQEMDFDDANNLLVKSTPPVLNNFDAEKSLQLFNQQTTGKQRKSTSGTGSPSSISVPSSQISGDQGDSSVMEDSMEVGTPSLTDGDAAAESPVAPSRDEPMPSRSPSPKIGFVGPVEKLLTYPPPPAKGGITITNEDLFCLNEGEFLNDVILDFYLKYLFTEKLSEEDRQRTHIFSSFFYKRLMQRQSGCTQDAEGVKLTPAQRRHSRVKTWTRQVDIFSKDFVLIPINEHSHWFLAVICFPGMGTPEYQGFEPTTPSGDESPGDGSENGNSKLSSSPSMQDEAGEEMKEDPLDTIDNNSSTSKTSDTVGKEGSGTVLGTVIPGADPTSDFSIGVKQPCILILDSLAGPPRSSIIRILKEYLQVEWDLKKKVPRVMTKIVRGGVPRVPQQNNYSDCGVFVLQYAEAFFENPICDFSIPMKGLSRWFPLGKVERKREEIRNLILQLQAQANATATS